MTVAISRKTRLFVIWVFGNEHFNFWGILAGKKKSFGLSITISLGCCFVSFERLPNCGLHCFRSSFVSKVLFNIHHHLFWFIVVSSFWQRFTFNCSISCCLFVFSSFSTSIFWLFFFLSPVFLLSAVEWELKGGLYQECSALVHLSIVVSSWDRVVLGKLIFFFFFLRERKES